MERLLQAPSQVLQTKIYNVGQSKLMYMELHNTPLVGALYL